MWRIFLLSIIVFSMSSFLSAKAAINPDTHYNGHGYKIFNDGMTWQQAKSYCENQGGHLVTITSSQEQAVVETLLRTRGTKNSYWLGGCKSGNAWVWVTGESFSYSRWATWQPDGDGDALMVYRQNNPVVPDATPLGSWNDIRFDGICKGEPFFGANNFGFICEWDTLQENSATVTIPDGWYRIQPMHDLSRSADALGSQIGNGNNIHMWTNVEDALQQKFYLQNRGNCYFSLQSAYGNKLFVTANGRGNGANLYTNNWNNSDSQLFRLVNAGNNSYHIYAKVGVNLNFDCYGGYASDGNNIQLWTKENNAWHKWRFTKVTVGNNPQGTVQMVESTSPNTLHVRGTAFDQDNPNGSIRLHVYVGGTPGSNVPQYEIRTNGSNRVFDDTRKIDSNYSGRQLVRIYALNDYGSGENVEIWKDYVNIQSNDPTPSGDYDSKVNSFKSDSKYRHNGDIGWDCGAYADEFAKFVFGKSSKTAGILFYNPDEIRAGDVVHVNPRNNSENAHWVVILYRNGSQLITMEGNWLSPKTRGLNGKTYGRTRYSDTTYTVENGKFCLNHNPFRKWDRGYHFK